MYKAQNEPVLDYRTDSAERLRAEAALSQMSNERPFVGPYIDGQRMSASKAGNRTRTQVVMPHDHAHVLAEVAYANAEDVQQAIDGALKASVSWSRTTLDERARIFLRAADLLTGRYRERILASCMLGQSKTVHQAEIDAICELADFFRFNVQFLQELNEQTLVSPRGMLNRTDLRPLEGFVYAIGPFNFLSIAANLPLAPILCGNVALWKPSTTSLLGCYHLLELLEEAGLPAGVLQMIPGDGPEQSEVALASPHLAAIHFTGSTPTFRKLYQTVANRLDRYRSFPRLVGETGGKDFIVAHPSANAQAVATAIVRGAFEYQGQKCSAASRMYVAKSLWKEVQEQAVADMNGITMGDIREFKHFMGAVIDERAFDRIASYSALAKSEASFVHGGECNKSKGYFVSATLAQVEDPKHRLMSEEIFGPIATVYVYEDARYEETLQLVDSTSPYALTGAIFSNDHAATSKALETLRNAAGNFYINDKPTGAVVGQQPFGGARGSGTNDKAGSFYNITRWLSPRSIKETFDPPRDFRYPYQR